MLRRLNFVAAEFSKFRGLHMYLNATEFISDNSCNCENSGA